MLFNFVSEDQKLRIPKIYLTAGILILACLAVIGLSQILPYPIDWTESYYPAARAFLEGRSPYEAGLNNPPWLLLFLAPLALLPMHIGRAVLFLIGAVGFAYSAHRLGAKGLGLIAFLLSPMVLLDLIWGNINWMPLLGATMSPAIGLFFVVLKPQIGIAVALFWLVEAWRKGGARQVLLTFGPLVVVTALSFLVFGFWPYRFGVVMNHTGELNQNHTLWPQLVPVGLGLLAAALYKRDIRFALGAGPCLSPYVLLYAWSGAMAAISPATWITVGVVALMYLAAFLPRLLGLF